MINLRLIILSALFLLLISCQDGARERFPEGKKLAQQYCVSCHSVPGPEALSKDLWEQILPRMGARLGINFTQAEAGYYQALRQVDMNPTAPALSQEEWEAIKSYYLANSPDTLPAFTTQIADEELTLFRPQQIEVSADLPAASLVRFDSTGFWYGDARKNLVYHYEPGSGERRMYQAVSAPSDIHPTENGFYLLTMGDIFPNDFYQGELLRFTEGNDPEVILDSLNRPVRMRSSDLNGDGRPDFVVCNFGHLTGSLDWYENTVNGYRRHVLRPEPGALNAEIYDFDGDGNKDILALMAQGKEGFYLYLGDGAGNFREQQIYSFPSYYGSSYFELKDMNGDGRPDIVYANGDTGDYNYPALKPYHGIHILIQNDNLEFEEAASFPVHGPFNTMAEDYDLDGDIDLAVTSYFPDFENTPRESFLFLENQGNLSFKAKSLPAAIWGNWLTADRADYDQDGDIDILLGNGPVIRSKVDPEIAQIWRQHPNSVILLENTAADNK